MEFLIQRFASLTLSDTLEPEHIEALRKNIFNSNDNNHYHHRRHPTLPVLSPLPPFPSQSLPPHTTKLMDP
ncbi:3268_t:CDS:1, partial [Ambispora gerdemannii]